jgi:hypothetical protein
MKALLRWAARMYPAAWRERYGVEFDALLDDMSPSFADLCNVVWDVLRVRAIASMDAAFLVLEAASPMSLRLPALVSVTVHGLMIVLVLLASWGYVTQMPRAGGTPLPPPFPEPPPQITDARVFPDASTLYSSLPLKSPVSGGATRIYVANGVGIHFLPLPDIGAIYRQGASERKVWPGQALDGFLVRRVLPEYPRGTTTRGAVSVFVEYLVLQDGSVKVLRTSGPKPFTSAAQWAIERWVYRPLWFENHPCEVISRVEVRFNGELADSEMAP